MRVLRRILRRLAVALLVAVIVAILAAGGLVGWIGIRALPQVSGRLAVPGLHSEVTVRRDATGIAQIYATTPDDLFFAQGYVHASERFWQMEVWRHAAAGRLSELFGTSTLDDDRYLRTLDFRRAGQADFDHASPATRQALQRYADGVNAWLDQNRGRLGAAFVIAGLKSGLGGGLGGYSPEPWTPADSTSFAKLQALSLGGNMNTEIFKTIADGLLGGRTDLTDALVPPYPKDGPVITAMAQAVTDQRPAAPAVPAAPAEGAPPLSTEGAPPAAAAAAPAAAAAAPAAPAARVAAGASTGAAVASPASAASLLALADVAAGIGPFTGLAPSGIAADGVGSNDWVVAPSKSAGGTALLANDPHLDIQMPSVWYMDGLHCTIVSDACPYDVVGVSFPSVPGVILGHNARIAWGATNVGPDVQDLYLETLDPKDPTRYRYKGASVPFTMRLETIKVAGAADVTMTVRETVHGPIVTDVTDLKGLSAPYALRWTALTEPDGLLDSFLALDRAGSFQQFRDALRSYGTPAQNFVYADVDGNIGYQMPGRIPIRPAADHGDRPVDGASGADDWQGYVPFDELPWLYNPPAGLIVTANNAVVDSTYPHLISNQWDPGWRATRIRQLLDRAAARGGVTQADMAAIQADTRLLRADSVVPALLSASPTTADGRAVQALIASWDRFCGVDSRGCTAYEVTEYRLTRALFEPWLGTEVRRYVGTSAAKLALRDALADPASPFWTPANVPAGRSRAGVIAGALDAAGADLRASLGDPTRWAWGNLHRSTFKELTLGSSGIAPIDGYFDAGPFGTSGSSDTVDATWWSWDAIYPDPTKADSRPGTLFDAFAVSVLPSYRLTVDLGHLDEATIIQTTGQSGNPMDRHYGDLVQDWLAGRSRALPFSRSAVDRATVSVLILTP